MMNKYLLTEVGDYMQVLSHTYFEVFVCSSTVRIRVRHGDAGNGVASPTLKNWPLFGQKFSKFGQSMQLHSYVSELVLFSKLRQKNNQINSKIIANTAKIVSDYFAILFCP